MSKTYRARGIVIKRVNYGEADRILTVFTREYGKLPMMARGVRKTTSRKRGSVELASEADFLIVKTKGMDLLSQCQQIRVFPEHGSGLDRITQVHQLLEITNLLTVDEQEMPEVYDILIETLMHLELPGTKRGYILSQVRLLLQELGFTYDKDFSEMGLKRYIEELANRKLKSKEYLTISR